MGAGSGILYGQCGDAGKGAGGGDDVMISFAVKKLRRRIDDAVFLVYNKEKGAI